MTKKDYIAIAAILHKHQHEIEIAGPPRRTVKVLAYGDTVNAFVALFEGDNPRFDAERFRDAVATGK